MAGIMVLVSLLKVNTISQKDSNWSSIKFRKIPMRHPTQVFIV